MGMMRLQMQTNPPLVDDLERFADGAAAVDLSENFKQWAEALARVRVQELLFQSLHKSLHTSLRCSDRLGMSLMRLT